MIEPLHHLTTAEYRAYDAVSQSDLKRCWENPQLYHAQYIAKTVPPDKSSPSQQWGTLLEDRLAGRANVLEIPRDVLNEQGHRKGKAWTDFAKRCDGCTLLTSQEMAELNQAVQNVRQHSEAERLWCSPSMKWSQRFTWPCTITSLQLKGEMDLLNEEEGWICDIKTAADVDVRSFERSAWQYGYDIQAAMYLYAAERLNADISWRYYWIVVRNQAPYNVEVYEASQSLIDAGTERLYERLHFFRGCVDSGRWLSPTHGVVQMLYPPRYAKELV